MRHAFYSFHDENICPFSRGTEKEDKIVPVLPTRTAPTTFSYCAGSLADLFSQRPWSRNEQHEPHAGSVPVRHQSHLQRCAEMLSSQAHGATQSAIRKRVSHLPGFSALTSDTGEEEECFSELVHFQRESSGAFDTGFPTAQARGSKLVTEDWKPVGSGRFRVPSQDLRGV